MIDISKLDRIEVLRALYASSKPKGIGTIHFTPDMLSIKDAKDAFAGKGYVDYLHGRVMKVSLPEGATKLDPWLYDHDNGQGAAERALETLFAQTN